MKYEVVLSKDAIKSLKKMDPLLSSTIISWIEKNLKGTDDPRRKGKPLTGNYAGAWSYRVGDFRIIAEIENNLLIIYVLEVRNRRNAYR